MVNGVLMECQMLYEDKATGIEIKTRHCLTPIPDRPGFLNEEHTGRVIKATQLTEMIVAVDDPLPRTTEPTL
jgi:hypothetical protein